MTTNAELFQNAVFWAQERQAWRRLANAGGSALYNRRQCLHRARQAESRVVDYAIRAEWRAEYETRTVSGSANVTVRAH